MLRKGQPIKFKRSGTNSERVYQAILAGNTTKHRIVIATSLPFQKVSTALNALVFSGNVQISTDGRLYRYALPGVEQITEASVSLIEASKAFFFGTNINEKYYLSYIEAATSEAESEAITANSVQAKEQEGTR